MRGKLYRPAQAVSGARITPAGAGKTIVQAELGLHGEDHPRRCGENSRALACRLRARGSPPQVRGKPMVSQLLSEVAGITPAGAGKTLERKGFIVTKTDHPRRCGENDVRLRKFDPVPGSPPQVRGKPFPHQVCRTDSRITPAGAGKTHYG